MESWAENLKIQFTFFLILVLAAKITIATMAVFYRDKFPGNRMTIYLANISQNRYHRDKWIPPVMDSVQFYVIPYPTRHFPPVAPLHLPFSTNVVVATARRTTSMAFGT